MQVAGFTHSKETRIYNEQLKSLKLKYRILHNLSQTSYILFVLHL